jgi:hydrogenase maturation protein HypF
MKRFFNHRDFTLLLTQLRRGLNITATTSTGRILDAAAALLGICTERTYDSEPALTLEAQGGFPDTHLKPVITDSAYADGRRYILQTAPLFQHLLEHRVQKTARLAATAQYYLACGFYQMAKKVNSHLPLTFSGGVAYNRIITTYLSQKGVLLNKKVPPGDGGISVGQLLT